MRIVSRGMAISLAALGLTGSAFAAPIQTVLYSFASGNDGSDPTASLIADNYGTLYGTTRFGGNRAVDPQGIGYGTVFKLTKSTTGWTETVLYRFCPQPTSCNDGAYPYAGLIAEDSGALYGTTTSGGSNGDCVSCGTVFKLTPPAKGQTTHWTETVLYSFKGGSDGLNPQAGLIADKSGALYGTTSAYPGTVFKLTPPAKGQTAWTETVLYNFCSLPNCSDGAQPVFVSLIADKSGALYGTTGQGGSSNYGTAFKLTPPAKGQTTHWTETVFYSFKGGSDGQNPEAGVIADDQGVLYSTTFFGGNGGSFPGDPGSGTVFKLTPPAKGQTVWTKTSIYSFCMLSNCNDGAFPEAGLIADKEGTLYGTTANGGSGVCNAIGCGTVFKLTPTKGQTVWNETVLYRFCPQLGCSDGSQPAAGLIADKEGTLYGTTQVGGTAGNGTVFKLTLYPEPK